jgi:2-keto-4-pentenoate hydratase/2-oxohepta-3-ene-1,7-dioic acid hydratase in catechol pathway
MKLVTFRTGRDAPKPGLVVEEGGEPRSVLDLSRAASLPSILALIQGGESALGAARDAAAKREGLIPWADIQLLAPIPRPLKNVFCVGRNYSEHVAEGYRARGQEVKLPEVPQFFTKPPTAVAAPGQPFEHDASLTTKLDYEVELALVIGKAGRDIPADRAYDHIFGYTIANDITARDLQRRHEQWFKGKGLDGS